MDPEDAGKMVGRMIPLVLALGLVAGVATRAAKLSPRSQRLGRYAVACGLAFLPLLCVATFARGPEGRVVMLGVGGLMVAAGAAAITLAARARSARTGDGGRPWAAVPGGILLGLVSITLGGGAILIPRVANPGGPAGPVADGTAWTHRVDPPGFEVALPSDRWRRHWYLHNWAGV